ncbi:DUF4468 domain-containing protein [Pedobacter nyackensis]|uniref:DUF4468 domain-containing protein n=1 Tax=Pedobacter nyackensis TaxID=475255 RepID=UPI002930F61F|nr:DUF4468 domain-containing protein [Pedobacter nyackensis]
MKLLTLVILLFLTGTGFAQEKPLATDDRGKLIYYEVVELKDVSKDSLRVRASGFLNKSAKSLKPKSADSDSLMSATGKLVINKTALVLSRPSGEVRYNFYVETKDGKYRFWLTDFNFIPYQRDRYGNFVPFTTVGMPLENKPGKLNAAEWAGYVKATTREVNLFAERFKDVMMKKIIVPPVTKVLPVSPGQKW